MEKGETRRSSFILRCFLLVVLGSRHWRIILKSFCVFLLIKFNFIRLKWSLYFTYSCTLIFLSDFGHIIFFFFKSEKKLMRKRTFALHDLHKSFSRKCYFDFWLTVREEDPWYKVEQSWVAISVTNNRSDGKEVTVFKLTECCSDS